MARFSLEEDGDRLWKKRGREGGEGSGGGGKQLHSSRRSKKGRGKERVEGDEAIEDRDAEEGEGIKANEEQEEEEEEEEEEEQGDGMEDETLGLERGQSSGNGSVCVRMDPEVLDCSICYEPLQPPIFQCHNGHVACSSCCSKLLNKCHICCSTIGFSRCLILEKVIDSIKFSCAFAKYGCNRTMSYTDKYAHEETCIYMPCLCPFLHCYFSGSSEILSDHIINEHTPYERFRYNQIFKVELHKTDPFRALYGEDGHLFLLLNDSAASVGNRLSVVCFRCRSLKWDFLYELTIDTQNSSCSRTYLQFKSLTTNITAWKVYPRNLFLLVPPDLCTATGKVILDVCIRRIKRTAQN